MIIMYCMGICVPLNPVQIPFRLHCVHLSELKNRKGATVRRKNEKSLWNQTDFLLRDSGPSSSSPFVFVLVPTGGTLTPNKIFLLHLLRKFLRRGCTHQAWGDDKTRLDFPLKAKKKKKKKKQKHFGFWTFSPKLIYNSLFYIYPHLTSAEDAVISRECSPRQKKTNQMKQIAQAAVETTINLVFSAVICSMQGSFCFTRAHCYSTSYFSIYFSLHSPLKVNYL